MSSNGRRLTRSRKEVFPFSVNWKPYWIDIHAPKTYQHQKDEVLFQRRDIGVIAPLFITKQWSYPGSEKLESISILNLGSCHQGCQSSRLAWMKALFKASVETEAIVWRIQWKWLLKISKEFKLDVHGAGISIWMKQLSQWNLGSSPADHVYLPMFVWF